MDQPNVPAQVPPAKKRSSCLIAGAVAGGGCLLLIIIGLVIGMMTGYSEWRAKNPAGASSSAATSSAPKETPVPVALQKYIDAMGRAYTELAGRTDFHATPCNAAAMTQATGKTSNIIMVLYGPFLKRFTQMDQAWSPDRSTWSFITDSAYRGHFEKNPKDRAAYDVEDTAKRVDDAFLPPRFVIVIWPDDEKQNTLPEMIAEKQYVGGEFRGWAVYVDQTNGSVVCMQRVVAKSSNEVWHRTRGLLKKDANTAIRDDFERSLQKAIDQTLPDGFTATTGFGSIFH